MKRSDFTFLDGFSGIQAKIARENGDPQMKFDWDKAAEIIKERFSNHPDLIAEAGLQRDWNYTGGAIFKDGKPTNDEYTYLSSNFLTTGKNKKKLNASRQTRSLDLTRIVNGMSIH